MLAVAKNAATMLQETQLPKLPQAQLNASTVSEISTEFESDSRREISTAGLTSKPASSEQRASHNWGTVRGAVNATRFWKRCANAANYAEQSSIPLGSLSTFLDRRTLKDVVWNLGRKDEEFSSGRATEAIAALESDLLGSSRPHTVPINLGGPRRKVTLVGEKLYRKRAACPRNKQLHDMIPRESRSYDRGIHEGAKTGEVWQRIWLHKEGLMGTDGRSRAKQAKAQAKPVWNVATADMHGRPFTVPAPSLAATPRELLAPVSARTRRTEDHTSFTLGMFSTSTTKPKPEVHQLLTAVEGTQHDDFSQHAPLESGFLAQRLDELRWGELRRGPWTNRPEKRRPAENAAMQSKEDKKNLRQADAPGKLLVAAALAKSAENAGMTDIHGDADSLQRLVHLMDPERTGSVEPDVFVPLMFWLGLTRKRSAALMTIELAFGPGSIDTAAVLKLSRYAEVQIRLIEGLRSLARRESLDQLAEYITDMARLRTWFQTMKRDTTGHADIVEVQSLFGRMEVTSDRQALFRFLSYVIQSDVLPSLVAERSAGHAIGHRTFRIGDFAALLCRCAMAWCVHRVLDLINPAEHLEKTGADDDLLMAPADVDRDNEMRWVGLQRKIIVSLLINHRFWGRESRTVLMSLTQPQMTTLGNLLSPEQWLSLFQRVRAQGIAATLPIGDEATEDPEWLRKKIGTVPRGNGDAH